MLVQYMSAYLPRSAHDLRVPNHTVGSLKALSLFNPLFSPAQDNTYLGSRPSPLLDPHGAIMDEVLKGVFQYTEDNIVLYQERSAHATS